MFEQLPSRSLNRPDKSELRGAEPALVPASEEPWEAQAKLQPSITRFHGRSVRLGHCLLAAEYGALSADHLEYTDDESAVAMANSGTTAVLLPGAFYVLREKKLPPVDAFRRHGVPLALATDCNPGTSPITSLLLIMNMAATLFRLTVDEALAGVTREAARALGRLGEIGTLEPGKRCDLAIWDIERPAELVYRIGFNPLHARVWGGA